MPLAVNVSLPRAWSVVRPEQLGVSGVLFMALHPTPQDQGFTANITIDGRGRSAGETLVAVADDAVGRIEQISGSVRLSDRAPVTTGAVEGLVQLLAFTAVVDGVERELVQRQAFLPVVATEPGAPEPVLQLALTATPEQYGGLVDDFTGLVDSVSPRAAAGGT